MISLKDFIKFFISFGVIYTFFFRAGLFFNSFNIDEAILFFSVINFEPTSIVESTFLHGGVWQGLINSMNYGSLDPGGYSLILSIWSLISTETFFLRGLSSLFFITGLSFLGSAVRLRTNSFLFSLIICSLLFFDPLVMNLSYTLRPYAMEACGTLFLIYFLVNFQQSTSKKKLALFIFLAIMMGSRYFFWFPVLIALTLELIFMMNGKRVEFLKKSSVLIFFIPLYLISFYHQYDSNSLGYLKDIFLFSDSENSALFFHGLVFIPILSFPFFNILKYLHSKKIDVISLKLSCFFFLFLTLSVLLDFVGLYPLHYEYKYSLSLHLLGGISVILVLSDLFDVRRTNSLASLITLFCLLIFNLSRNSYTFEPSSHLVSILEYIRTKVPRNAVVYCDEFVFRSLYMVKNVAKAKYDWDRFPHFVKITSKESLKLKKDAYILLHGPLKYSGINVISPPLLNSGPSQLIGDHFENLYYFEVVEAKED